MVTARTIASNTVFYTAALTLQKIISFAYFSYLARSLGAVLTGKYFFALSIAAVVIAVLDIGLTPVLTREASHEEGSAFSIANQVLTLKFILAILFLAVAIPTIYLVLPDTVTQHLLIIAFVIAFFDSMSMALYGAVRARQNLRFESYASVIFQVVLLILGGFAVMNGYDIRIVMGALAVASLINTLIGLGSFRSIYKRFPKFFIDRVLMRRILILAAPFAMASIFMKVYAYIDAVLLSFFLGDAAVGVYSVAYKITFAFQFIPLAFIAALYPALSYYWKHDKKNLVQSFMSSFEYLMLISLPIALGLVAVSDLVIPAVYTEAYRATIMPLNILLLSLPLLFVNFPIGSLLNACNMQTRQMWHLGITMVLNIVLNLVLIRRFGPSGAAVASSVSTLFIFILGVIVARRLLAVTFRPLVVRSLKIFLIAFFMMLIARGLTMVIDWYGAILVAGLFYVVSIFMFKIVNKADAHQFFSYLKR